MHVLRVVEALIVLVIVDLLMRRGTRALYAALRVLSHVHVPWAASSHDAVVAAVDEASVWYCHRVLCLQRSAALRLMLWIRGVPSQLVIGFRPVPFRSHAWVERNERVINDRQQYKLFFKVLDTL
jgi:hypothetical protein